MILTWRRDTRYYLFKERNGSQLNHLAIEMELIVKIGIRYSTFRYDFDILLIPLWYHIVEIDRLIELSVKSSIFGKIYYSDHFPFYNYDYLYISNYLPIV